MATCPLDLPQCKRQIMTSSKPFEKQQCPLNVKPRCSLIPPSCPLLESEETQNLCGLSKIQNPVSPVDMSKCPGRCPCKPNLSKGCPVTLGCCSQKNSISKDVPNRLPENNKSKYKFPDIPCPLENCCQSIDKSSSNKSETEKTSDKVKIPENHREEVSKNNSGKLPDANKNKDSPNKHLIQDNKNNEKEKCKICKSPEGVEPTNSKTCPLGAKRRPLPCAECIFDAFARKEAGEAEVRLKKCPYLRLADICGPQCKCPEVPDVTVPPRCPYLPEPCPCCARPKCAPDCPAKPAASPLSPQCFCGRNCLGQVLPFYPEPQPPKSDCSCTLCLVGASCRPPIDPPDCFCKGRRVDPSCPFRPAKCTCGSCVSTSSCCAPKPPCCTGVCCTCLLCTLNKICQPPCPTPSPCCAPKPCACICGTCPPGKALCCTCLLCCMQKVSCPPDANPCPNPCICICGSCSPGMPLCCKCLMCCLKKVLCPSNKDCNACICICGMCPLGETLCCNCLLCCLKKIPFPSDGEETNKSCECTCGGCPLGSVLCCECLICCLKKACTNGKPKCPLIPSPCTLDEDDPRPSPPKSTFHVPICSAYKPPCSKHFTSNGESELVCPFSPHPCPLGDTCPFPVPAPRSTGKVDNAESKKEKPKNLNEESNKKDEDEWPNCGIIPDPECPAAKFLTPDRYREKPKPEIQQCPFKKCMKTPGCPINKAMPKVDCPTPEDCPFSKEPECPITEIMGACSPCSKCPCAPPSGCAFSKDPTKPGCALNLKKKQVANRTGLNGSRTSENERSRTELDGTSCYKKSMEKEGSSTSSNECPLSSCVPKPPRCPLLPPPCPLTPKERCPFLRRPEPCALTLGKDKPYCPIEYPPCEKFPDGRCPMRDLNTCDCDYPVAPCLLPPQGPDVMAPPQYCVKEDCCMGLSLPPFDTATDDPNARGEGGYYFKFMDTKPGREETKHYVQVMTEPPTAEIGLFGPPRKRTHDNWSVIKHGEGYKKCKAVAKMLEDAGPRENRKTQYNEEDCPLDPDILKLKKARQRETHELDMMKKKMGLTP